MFWAFAERKGKGCCHDFRSFGVRRWVLQNEVPHATMKYKRYYSVNRVKNSRQQPCSVQCSCR